MQKRTLMLAVLVLIAATTVLAQRGPRSHMYDPQTVQTFSGTIVSVDRIPAGRSVRAGIHITLHTDARTLDVAIGPAWFVDDLDMKLVAGDRVDVKGSLMKVKTGDVLIAAEVKRGDATMVLRDADGFPAWARARR